MIIPYVPLTRVINNTIIYSDTVLSLKDNGNNIKVTSINDIYEYEIERCLNLIFKSNPNVIFNSIQYSKNNNKLYFYTDKEISIKEYINTKVVNYQQVTTKKEILEELKNILVTEKNTDNNCISLYDIANRYKKEYNRYNNIKDYYVTMLESNIRSKYSKMNIIIYSFDYKKNDLIIGFEIFSEYKKIHFTKKDNDLFISKSETRIDKYILSTLGNDLSKVYDEYIKYKDFNIQTSYKIKPINTNFLVDINKYDISISMDKYFKLCAYNYKNEYIYNCNSTSIINEFKGKETEIFKKIFVKIDNCPKWSQEYLYKLRQEQLEKENIIQNKALKKQKRLELTKKILPFIKR